MTKYLKFAMLAFVVVVTLSGCGVQKEQPAEHVVDENGCVDGVCTVDKYEDL